MAENKNTAAKTTMAGGEPMRKIKSLDRVRGFDVLTNGVMIFLVVFCLMPLVLLVMSSFTDETTLVINGYNFIPEKFSLKAYLYLLNSGKTILRSYGMSILVTTVGTVLSICFTTTLGYAISKEGLPFRGFLNFYVFFTMLFNGGLVPTYLMYTGTFQIKNTVFALIIPNLLLRAYYVILMRSYFQTSMPNEVLEAAQVDGATEFQIFYKIAIPMAKPIIATVLMFTMITYWNDWQNGLYYITTNTKLYTVQNLLNRMMQEIQFLAQNAGQIGAAVDAAVPSATVRMAIAVIGILPIAIIYPFVQNNFAKGITLGAVKG